MYKYNQKLPEAVEKDLDTFIERVKAVQWFKPAPGLTKEKVETAVAATVSAFGLSATVEYRTLKTESDWDAAWNASCDAAWNAAWNAARVASCDAAWNAAWNAARVASCDAAWNAAWNAARVASCDASLGACEILASHTGTYKLPTPFLKLFTLWEMGLYPCGVIDGKFVVYVPDGTTLLDEPVSQDNTDLAERVARIEEILKHHNFGSN